MLWASTGWDGHDSHRDEMVELWREHLAVGLRAVSSTRHADFTFGAAFYGSLYDVTPGWKGIGDGRQISPGFEMDFLQEMAGPDATDRKVYLPGGVQWALRKLQSTDFFAGVGHYAIIRFVKQVGRYFADPELRVKVQEEFLDAVGGETSVVVAHSLGSVVAYEVLRDNPDIRVDALITVGSPLGTRVVRERIGLGLQERGGRPAGIRRWVNVAATEDAIALVKELADHYTGVEDSQVSNTRLKAHLAVRYLAATPTSEAIRRVLG